MEIQKRLEGNAPSLPHLPHRLSRLNTSVAGLAAPGRQVPGRNPRLFSDESRALAELGLGKIIGGKDGNWLRDGTGKLVAKYDAGQNRGQRGPAITSAWKGLARHVKQLHRQASLRIQGSPAPCPPTRRPGGGFQKGLVISRQKRIIGTMSVL